MNMNEAEKRFSVSPRRYVNPATLWCLAALGLSPTGRLIHPPAIQQPVEISEKRDPIPVILNQPRRRKRSQR